MHIQIGSSYLDPKHILWVAPFRSRPIKRKLKENSDQVTDWSQGKKILSVIYTDTGHYFLSANAPEQIIEKQKNWNSL